MCTGTGRERVALHRRLHSWATLHCCLQVSPNRRFLYVQPCIHCKKEIEVSLHEHLFFVNDMLVARTVVRSLSARFSTKKAEIGRNLHPYSSRKWIGIGYSGRGGWEHMRTLLLLIPGDPWRTGTQTEISWTHKPLFAFWAGRGRGGGFVTYTKYYTKNDSRLNPIHNNSLDPRLVFTC